jgi:hypothetical protein
VFHLHYKELESGNNLFSVVTEYTEYGMLVIGINTWEIIKPNGDKSDKSNYSALEMELAQQSVELSSYNERNDLIRF